MSGFLRGSWASKLSSGLHAFEAICFRGQKLMLNIFFYCSSRYCWKQGLSLNLQLTDWLAFLTSQFQRFACLCLPAWGLKASTVAPRSHMGAGDMNLAPHAYTPDASPPSLSSAPDTPFLKKPILWLWDLHLLCWFLLFCQTCRCQCLSEISWSLPAPCHHQGSHPFLWLHTQLPQRSKLRYSAPCLNLYPESFQETQNLHAQKLN